MDDISNLEPPMLGKFLIPSLLAMLLVSDQAFAHTGVGTVFSFSSGFQHPLGGLDHLLAMFAVGLLAAQLGGNALWFVPGAFVAMMIAGALIGLVGFEVPGVELGIAISIVAMALPVAFALGMPAGVAMVYVGFFALFHGYAHGAELPVDADAALYVGGFTFATAFIHAAGASVGLGIGWVDVLRRNHGLRVAGAVLAIAGIGFLTA
jgi:urease accessory protein